MMHSNVDWPERARAAEKTVEVLKRKVLAMYAGESQSALHRALEVAKHRNERNSRRRELMEVRTGELAKHNAQLEEQVVRRARAIKVILDNVTCGFLRVQGDGVVQDGWSHSCHELFEGTTIAAGQEFARLLGITKTPQGVEFQLGIDQVFEDILPEEVSLAQMPSRFDVGDKVLAIEGRLIRDASGRPESILYTINDDTELEKARSESREREVLIEILRRKVAFEQFVEDFGASMNAVSSDLSEQSIVRRTVHTIKGNAASWGLHEVVRSAHLAEEHRSIEASHLTEIADAMRSYLARNFDLLGVSYDHCEPAFDVRADELRALRALVGDPSRVGEIEAWVAGVLRRPAREFLGPIRAFAEGLAGRLGKSITFEITGEDVGVASEAVGPVLRNVCHLVRNAIDHGVEEESSRGSKPARGRVAVEIREDDEAWHIAVSDDGCGVRTDALVERAIARGSITREVADRMSYDDRVALMFVEGVSTAETATEVSGRGVGMSSVRECVQRAGGSIATTTGPAGTTFVLSVPREAARAKSNDTLEVNNLSLRC